MKLTANNMYPKTLPGPPKNIPAVCSRVPSQNSIYLKLPRCRACIE